MCQRRALQKRKTLCIGRGGKKVDSYLGWWATETLPRESSKKTKTARRKESIGQFEVGTKEPEEFKQEKRVPAKISWLREELAAFCTLKVGGWTKRGYLFLENDMPRGGINISETRGRQKRSGKHGAHVTVTCVSTRHLSRIISKSEEIGRAARSDELVNWGINEEKEEMQQKERRRQGTKTART